MLVSSRHLKTSVRGATQAPHLSTSRLGNIFRSSLPSVPKSRQFSTLKFTGVNRIYGNYWAQTKSKLRKQLLLLRGEMIKKRTLNLPELVWRMLIPKQQFQQMVKATVNGTGNGFQISISELTGHAAFLFSAAAFLEKDILFLRIYAVCSIALSILFQFYREIPLWIPIRWNFLFIAINTLMVGLLLKDAHEAKYLPAEQMKVYDQFFSAADGSGMTIVDFMHLMKVAVRHEMPNKGHSVLEQDSLSTRVWLVVDGACQVSRDEEPITECGPGFFLGEMGFVKWRDIKHELRQREADKEAELIEYNKKILLEKRASGETLEKALSLIGGESSPSGLPVKVGNSTDTIMRYDNDESSKEKQHTWEPTDPNQIIALLDKNRINHKNIVDAPGNESTSTSSSLTKSWRQGVHTFMNLLPNTLVHKLNSIVSTTTHNVESNSATTTIGESNANIEVADRRSHNGKNVRILAGANSEGVMASAGVKTWTDNVVLYSWTFTELHELLEEQPQLALVLERSFSSDLQKKMRSNDVKVKYKYVLVGAMSNLKLGPIDKNTNMRECEKLDKNTLQFIKDIRNELSVSDDVHDRVIRELGLSKSLFDAIKSGEEEDTVKEQEADDEGYVLRAGSQRSTTLTGAGKFIKSLAAVPEK